MSDDNEETCNGTDELKDGCGCSLMILAVGIAITLITLANAIAAGSIPAPW